MMDRSKYQINQRKQPPFYKIWTSLGKFKFEKGNIVTITISTEGTNGFVVADSVQLHLDL